MIRFWAKTTSDNQPGISVFEHLVNVGTVAQCMAYGQSPVPSGNPDDPDGPRELLVRFCEDVCLIVIASDDSGEKII